jgi:hypothetical protein
MSLKVGTLQKLLEKQVGVSSLNKRFWQALKKFNLPKIILDLINKGISPVEAGVRFIQYSKKYINQIRGVNDKGEKVKSRATSEGANSKLSFGKNSKSRKTNKVSTSLASRYGKKVSPVSLKLTGEMQSTLSYNQNTGILLADHELWVFHNEGMGNLPERRLLPNRAGEGFNRRIEQKITEALNETLGLKGNKVKKFITVRYNIK